jgi:photosystem II stability/assembly factor-like uncharacterized protein
MTRLSPLAGAFLACAPLILSPAAAAAQSAPLTPSLVQELRFRSVGPAVAGGRIHDVEAVPGEPATLYVASASGGIWKSVNKGTTWHPIFDNQAVSTFGDLAIAPSNPRVIWAGTGEQNNRQSTSWGNGVYRSTDAGATWTHLGLEETRHIGRVRVHPDNPDIAYVAALGNLWKPSSERGVFKTTDGGRSWTRVLYVDTLTGVVDLVMDPRDPNTLYAAAYQRLRQPWGFNGGGPGSGILKTTDGGKTWMRLANGIPAGDKGRIGLAIAASDPRVLNATIEHATEGGTYRSEDGGQTWIKVNTLNPRPIYYSHIEIDPTNANRVYILAVEFYRSEDGGRTFREMPTRPTYDVGVHSDHHSLWINPANPEHFFLAGDGGLHETWDGGETYDRINNIPIGQFYAIGADMREPYFIYGGMQDNHSWMGPNATRSWIGIINDEWRQIGFGDGMYQQPDPTSHRYVYTNAQNGELTRLDAETGDLLDLKPTPPPGEPSYRWDWVTPSLVSRHDPQTVYFGGNRLFISRDRGVSWERTEDLTRQVNRDTLRIMGVMGSQPMLSKHDGEQSFSEITTISESPLEPTVLWVGTDDGNVQVSRDGGRSWTEVGKNVRGVPRGTYVSRVLASAAAPGTAYVTFDAHRSGDFAPYVFRTTDFGQRWTPVVGGLPSGSVNVIAEHPANPQVLFLGTEHSLWVSADSGRGWTRLGTNLPTTLYDDLLVHPREGDLVVGTHGRSIWILDDAAPLAEWSREVAAKPAHLFRVRPASIYQYWKDTSYRGQSAYAGENPPHGAILNYHLALPMGSAQITIADSAGRVIRRLDVPAEAGTIRRVVWDLRHEPPPVESESSTDGNTQPALPHSVAPRGPFVSPGRYTATLHAGEARATQTVLVRGDPKMTLSDAQHREREAFLLEVAEMQREVSTAARRARTLRAGLTALRDSAGAGVSQLDSVTVLEDRLGGRSGRGGLQGQIYSLANDFNGGGVRQGSLYPPTQTHRRRNAELESELRELQRALDRAEAASRRQPGTIGAPLPR